MRNIYIWLLILASCTFFTLAFGTKCFCKVDPATAIGIWLFDEGTGKTANDSSGRGNHGKIVGAKFVDGQFGKALYFDGNDNCVEVPNSDSLNPTEKLTIVMWVKPDQGLNCDGNNNWRYLISKGGWGSYHLIWESDWGLNEVGWTLKIGGADKRLWTSTGAPPEKWTHLGFTYDSKDGSKVYVNGKNEPGKSAQGPANGSITINTGVLKIGGGSSVGCPNGNGYFGGIIDDVGMFEDALSEADIALIMDKGLQKVVGGRLSVEHGNKIASTWAKIKQEM